MDSNYFLPLLKVITTPDGQGKFFVFVVFLTVFISIIRISLRINLWILSSQVNKLIIEKSFKPTHSLIKKIVKRSENYKTQNNSDRFNALVIIERVYSENKLLIASRDSWDFICRAFPNILISLGLFGTFVGITANLSSIQEILKNQKDTTNILIQLQEPLNGMSTAFVSSLIALICGISLTFINLMFNTTVAKYRFFSLLEDYLNNSVVFNNSPTDILLEGIKESLEQFKSFMEISFTNLLASTISNAFTTQVEKIITKNEKAIESIIDLNTCFRESSVTISNSAEHFKIAADVLSESKLSSSINIFSDSLEKATSVFEQTSVTVSRSSDQFQDSIGKLDVYTTKFIELNQSLNQLIQITQSNEENLLEAIPTIQQEREILSATVELIRNLQSNIELSAKSLNMKTDESILAKAELVRLTRAINAVTEKITEKLYQGLDFDNLHNDNQIIIQLLQKIVLDLDADSLNQSETANHLQSEQKINELILVINDASSQLLNSSVIANEDNYQINQSLTLIKNELQQATKFLSLQQQSLKEESNLVNGSQSLKIDGINEIGSQIFNLSKLITSINEQILIISQGNQRQEDDKSELFPTTKKIVSNIRDILSRQIINKTQKL